MICSGGDAGWLSLSGTRKQSNYTSKTYSSSRCRSTSNGSSSRGRRSIRSSENNKSRNGGRSSSSRSRSNLSRNKKRNRSSRGKRCSSSCVTTLGDSRRRPSSCSTSSSSSRRCSNSRSRTVDHDSLNDWKTMSSTKSGKTGGGGQAHLTVCYCDSSTFCRRCCARKNCSGEPSKDEGVARDSSFISSSSKRHKMKAPFKLPLRLPFPRGGTATTVTSAQALLWLLVLGLLLTGMCIRTSASAGEEDDETSSNEAPFTSPFQQYVDSAVELADIEGAPGTGEVTPVEGKVSQEEHSPPGARDSHLSPTATSVAPQSAENEEAPGQASPTPPHTTEDVARDFNGSDERETRGQQQRLVGSQRSEPPKGKSQTPPKQQRMGNQVLKRKMEEEGDGGQPFDEPPGSSPEKQRNPPSPTVTEPSTSAAAAAAVSDALAGESFPSSSASSAAMDGGIQHQSQQRAVAAGKRSYSTNQLATFQLHIPTEAPGTGGSTTSRTTEERKQTQGCIQYYWSPVAAQNLPSLPLPRTETGTAASHDGTASTRASRSSKPLNPQAATFQPRFPTNLPHPSFYFPNLSPRPAAGGGAFTASIHSAPFQPFGQGTSAAAAEAAGGSTAEGDASSGRANPFQSKTTSDRGPRRCSPQEDIASTALLQLSLQSPKRGLDSRAESPVERPSSADAANGLLALRTPAKKRLRETRSSSFKSHFADHSSFVLPRPSSLDAPSPREQGSPPQEERQPETPQQPSAALQMMLKTVDTTKSARNVKDQSTQTEVGHTDEEETPRPRETILGFGDGTVWWAPEGNWQVEPATPVQWHSHQYPLVQQPLPLQLQQEEDSYGSITTQTGRTETQSSPGLATPLQQQKHRAKALQTHHMLRRAEVERLIRQQPWLGQMGMTQGEQGVGHPSQEESESQQQQQLGQPQEQGQQQQEWQQQRGWPHLPGWTQEQGQLQQEWQQQLGWSPLQGWPHLRGWTHLPGWPHLPGWTHETGQPHQSMLSHQVQEDESSSWSDQEQQQGVESPVRLSQSLSSMPVGSQHQSPAGPAVPADQLRLLRLMQFLDDFQVEQQRPRLFPSFEEWEPSQQQGRGRKRRQRRKEKGRKPPGKDSQKWEKRSLQRSQQQGPQGESQQQVETHVEPAEKEHAPTTKKRVQLGSQKHESQAKSQNKAQQPMTQETEGLALSLLKSLLENKQSQAEAQRSQQEPRPGGEPITQRAEAPTDLLGQMLSPQQEAQGGTGEIDTIERSSSSSTTGEEKHPSQRDRVSWGYLQGPEEAAALPRTMGGTPMQLPTTESAGSVPFHMPVRRPRAQLPREFAGEEERTPSTSSDDSLPVPSIVSPRPLSHDPRFSSLQVKQLLDKD